MAEAVGVDEITLDLCNCEKREGVRLTSILAESW